MFAVKCVDEKYISNESVRNIFNYVMNVNKTVDDNYRGLRGIDCFYGMSYFYPQFYAEGIAEEVITFNHIYRNTEKTQVFHRVISFEKKAVVNGNDLKYLMERMMNKMYSDYLWAYGIHMDSECIHVHMLICAVSMQWKRFSISYEIEWMRQIIGTWYEAHSNEVFYYGEDKYYKNL